MSNKARPIPFSGEPTFVEFLDEMAKALSSSRSGYLRQAAKEFARTRYPQIHAKHFPMESDLTPPSPTREPEYAQVPLSEAPASVSIDKPVIIEQEEEDDFLSTVRPNKEAKHVEVETIAYGPPEFCLSCDVEAEIKQGLTVVKTNISRSTSPRQGKWICNECTASGRYFPDKPPTLD